MSLRFAILVSLQSKQRTGYEIAREFDRGVSYFWQASHQQIYRELGKLANDGAVEFTQVEQHGRPAKKVYRITKRGRTALKTWLETPAPTPTIKDELLVKLYAGDLADAAKLLQETERHRLLYSAQLEEYHAIEQLYFSPPADLTVKQRYVYLTLRRGIHATQSWLAWSDEVIEFLRSRIA